MTELTNSRCLHLVKASLAEKTWSKLREPPPAHISIHIKNAASPELELTRKKLFPPGRFDIQWFGSRKPYDLSDRMKYPKLAAIKEILDSDRHLDDIKLRW